MDNVLRASRALAAALAAALLCFAAPAAAHEGEDHAPQPVASTGPSQPAGSAAGEAHSRVHEVVIVQSKDERRLTIYLDAYATNAPVERAFVSLVIGQRQIPVRAVGPGTFEAVLAEPLPHGRTNILVEVRSALASDRLVVPMLVPEHAHAEDNHGFHIGSVPLAIGGLLLLLAVGGGFYVLRRRSHVAAGLLVLAGLGAFGTSLHAHEDEPHGDEPAPAAGAGTGGGAADRPIREADGTVLLPKPSQRIIGVRTLVGEVGTGAASTRLQGQVVPDPAGYAQVATGRGGRVLAGTDFPRPGQAVRAGQVLFQLQPALSAAEAASSAAELRSLDREIRLAEQEARRLSQLRGIVARAEIERAQANLAGLRAQRGAAAAPVQSAEAVRAPIGGTVSTVSTAIGAVAAPGTVLAEIVGNSGWLIEARGLAPGQQLAVGRADGVTADGRRFALRLLGRNPQLVEGADRFLFAVDGGAAGLRGGEAITVEAVLVGAAVRSGIVLPNNAVTRGSSGEATIWVKPSALRFEPRQVRTETLPGGRVLVLAGIRPGERVVTDGAALLGQIR